MAFDTGGLEGGRGMRNFRWSGEMHKYRKEHRWRKQRAGPFLTLRREARGANGIRYPVVLALNDGYWVVDWTWVHSRSKSVKYPTWGVWSQG